MLVRAGRVANTAGQAHAPFDPLSVAALAFSPPAATRAKFRLHAPLALALVWAAHVCVWIWLDRRVQPDPVTPATARIEVVLIQAPPPPLIAPPARSVLNQSTRPTRLPNARPQRSAQPASAAEMLPNEPLPAPRLFAPDGSLLGIEAQVKTLDDRASARATFDYQIAGVAEAEGAFELPQSMEVKATRFDRYWKPDANLLDDMLERAVKASTLVVSVPVPGMPGYSVNCAVVVIAAVGSCGLSEPAELVYDIDDPNTLSAEEAAACQTIWERITSATNQSGHRRLRQIYDLGCRLPLADARAPKGDARPQGFPSAGELKKILRQ